MSFKNKLLQLYAKFDLNPTSLSKILGYKQSEKISRLTRDEKNLPSYEILSDIINAFPNLDARWLLTEDEEILMEPTKQYGFCKECIKKEGIIEHLKAENQRLHKEIGIRDRRIDELTAKTDEPPTGKQKPVAGRKAS